MGYNVSADIETFTDVHQCLKYAQVSNMALGSAGNKEERAKRGRWFRNDGLIKAHIRVLFIEVLCLAAHVKLTDEEIMAEDGRLTRLH